MEKIYKLGKIEAIALLISVTTNLIILNFPNIIIFHCGSSSWLNIIYVSILATVFGIIITKLFKRFQSKDLLDISEYIGGKFLKSIIGILYVAFFLVLTVMLYRYFVNSLKLIYFQNTPLVFLLLLFLIPPIVCNKISFKGVSSVNLLFMPIIIISILVLLFSSIKDFVPQRLFPIWGYGINSTFGKETLNLFIFTNFAYLYFLNPLLKNTSHFKFVTISSTIISGVYLLLSVLSLLMTFSFITSTDELLSLYLLSRKVNLGTFFQRIDALFIFLWIINTLSFLTINFFFILRIIGKLTHLKNVSELSLSLGSIVLSSSLLIKNISNVKFWNKYVFSYVTIILVYIISLIILIIANIMYSKNHKEISP